MARATGLTPLLVAPSQATNTQPVAGVALILLGILLLLHTLDLLDFERVARYWPVTLIAGGAYLLWTRLSGGEDAAKEAGHGRRA